jgi:hypothetical protein
MDHPIRPLLIVATVYGLGRKKSTPALAPRPGVNLTKIFLPPARRAMEFFLGVFHTIRDILGKSMWEKRGKT